MFLIAVASWFRFRGSIKGDLAVACWGVCDACKACVSRDVPDHCLPEVFKADEVQSYGAGGVQRLPHSVRDYWPSRRTLLNTPAGVGCLILAGAFWPGAHVALRCGRFRLPVLEPAPVPFLR